MKKILFPFFFAVMALTSCATEPSIDSNPPTMTKRPTSTVTEAPSIESSNIEKTPCNPMFVELANDIVYIPIIEENMGIELLETADFNQDGHTDLLVTRIVFQTQINSPIEILLNDGTGRMRAATEELFPTGIPTLHHPTEVLIADYNLDGIPDAYIADEGMDKDPFPGNHNTLILSQLDGTFIDASNKLPFRSDETHSAAIADIDLDGDTDIFVGNIGAELPPYVLINDGKGNFMVGEDIFSTDLSDQMKHWYLSSRFADVNNDGTPDLILGQAAVGAVSHIYLNNGNGKYTSPPIELPATPLGEDSAALDIDPIDLNQDSWLDLVLVYTTNAYMNRFIQILINDKNGGFVDQSDTRISQSTSGDWLRFSILTDINNDGYTDFFVAPITTKPILYLNNGNGSFSQGKLNFELFNFAIADFDGDGSVDIMNSGGAYQNLPEFHSTFISQGCP